jgi:glycolate oxidase iron-sulfur subunit
MIDVFDAAGVDYVVINAAGCGHTLKEYHHILQDDPEYRDRATVFSDRVKDIHEFLAMAGLTAKLHSPHRRPIARGLSGCLPPDSWAEN